MSQHTTVNMNIRSPLVRAVHQKLIEDNTVQDTTEVDNNN